jgi:hypothetical protein
LTNDAHEAGGTGSLDRHIDAQIFDLGVLVPSHFSVLNSV